MPPLPQPPLRSLPDYIESLTHLGRRPALVEQGLYRSREFTYADLTGKAFAFARRLHERGVAPEARIGIWGPAGAAWVIAWYGAILAGLVVVPMDAAFSWDFVRRALQQSEAAVLCAPSAPDGAPGLFFSFDELVGLAPAPLPSARPAPGDAALAEIVYTSGATAEPRGVMITHGNLLANLRPVAAEIAKYKRRARPFLPLRFLHLIPLSHLFGQVMGVLIPPLLDGVVIYPVAQLPEAWAGIIRARRVSVMVCVPQQLQLLSQWALAGVGGDAPAIVARSRGHGIAWRWWHWRRLHRRLGWKMWAFVVGAAALPPEQEELWNALGYAVVQGYGLTETAPAIAITHPFKIRRGAVGRKLAGVEIHLAPDGEILVRGPNVSPGYYHDEAATRAAFADGWLHTGDLGRLDEQGNLHFLGRKKEVIVTPEGLNVFPADVERALEHEPEISEAAAVEADPARGGGVHAVLVPAAGVSPEALAAAVARANGNLEAHQRVRAWTQWPESHLPRTASTHKLQRLAIARSLRAPRLDAAAVAGPATATDWRAWLHERFGIAPARLRPEARLDTDLGLGSLDRVELFAWLQTHAGVADLDEEAIAAASTVADLERLLALPAGGAAPAATATPTAQRTPAAGAATPAPDRAPARAPLPFDTGWPLASPMRWLRTALRPLLVVGPLRLRALSRLRVRGREHLGSLHRPVLFVSNHQSLLDVPVILAALPRRWRPWLAPAMGADVILAAHLLAHTSPARRRWERWKYWLVRVVFNVFLLSEHGALMHSLRYAGRAADRGYCPLIFPEGARTRDGRMQPLRPGIGVFIADLRLPVVPIRVDGLFEILPIGGHHVRRGPVRVRFFPPLEFANQAPAAITAALQAFYDRAES